MRHIPLGVLLLASCALVACTAPTRDDGLSNEPPPASSTGGQGTLISTDTAVDPTVRRLEREAIALARVNGCTNATQCRSAGMGNRPCGGPRYYVPYCPLTTDTAALLAKLAEVARAETEYNQRSGMMSTCEMRMPGELVLTGGACRFK